MVTNSKNKVINIKIKDYEMVSYFLGIDIRVRMTYRKTSVKGKAINFGIPGSRSLLKSIHGLLKVTYKGRG